MNRHAFIILYHTLISLALTTIASIADLPDMVKLLLLLIPIYTFITALILALLIVTCWCTTKKTMHKYNFESNERFTGDVRQTIDHYYVLNSRNNDYDDILLALGLLPFIGLLVLCFWCPYYHHGSNYYQLECCQCRRYPKILIHKVVKESTI